MVRMLLFCGVCALTILFGCRKDVLIKDSSAKLTFSTDTVIFDTVFTTIGSITELVKVYNPHNRTIKITSIEIAGGNSSLFRMNVNGNPGSSASNIEIDGGDSIFIFLEVTVDPNNQNTPLVISDSLVFVTNGNMQDVKLVAWGQDAHYHVANDFIGLVDDNNDTLKIWYHSVECNSTWENDKPHVVYGYAIVEPNCVLTIAAGTQVHFHPGSGLLVGNPAATATGASLKVNGTFSEPVTFQGDRLEWDYHDIPGQWDRIWFSATSSNNEVNYAIIKNGNIGIQADSNITPGIPTVKLRNTIIQDQSGVGILGQGAHIEATNCLIASCGQYSIALAYGGEYDFTHCSIGNYWNYSSRTTPAVLLNNYYEVAGGVKIVRDLKRAYFNNCIIYGLNDTTEIGFDKHNDGEFVYKFTNCVIKTNKATTDTSRYVNIVKNPGNVVVDGAAHDPLFNDYSADDLHLFSQSKALDVGDGTFVTGDLLTDMEGNARSTTSPDAGCYEFVP